MSDLGIGGDEAVLYRHQTRDCQGLWKEAN